MFGTVKIRRMRKSDDEEGDALRDAAECFAKTSFRQVPRELGQGEQKTG